MRLTISLTRALALVLALVVGPASAQMTLTGAGSGSKGAAAAPSFINAGGASDPGNTGASVSGSINIGTASSNRIVVVAATYNSAVLASTVTVGGVSCTADVNINSVAIYSCPGASYGSGSQTVSVTWASGNFIIRGFTVWVLSNCTSSTVVNTANNPSGQTAVSINVAAKDLMFSAAQLNNDPTIASYATSSVAPTDTGSIMASGNFYGSYADWLIASSNATFSVTPDTSSTLAFAVATYH